MIFASKTPRDLNHDPKPWRTPRGYARQSHNVMGILTHDPRPENDHPQHNEPNPILVAFRGRAADESLDFWLWGLAAESAFGGWVAWENPRHPFHILLRSSETQRDHARRVLTRLANLSGTTD